MFHSFYGYIYEVDETVKSLQHAPQRFFWGGECDETTLMERYWQIQTGDVVVDAGAHIGSWTLPALAMGAKHVYCFEPSVECCETLQKNISLNSWERRATVIQKALWHKNEETIFYEGEMSTLPQTEMIRVEEGTVYEVECVPLDSFTFERLDWIKIDVEGAELAVLLGAKETILRHKPRMIIEIHLEPIRTVIPDFSVDKLADWLPPSSIEKIDDIADTPRLLVVPT